MALTSRAYVIVELETSSWKCAVSREVIGMDIIDIISFRPSPTVASDMHMLLNWEYLFADICGVGGGVPCNNWFIFVPSRLGSG